VAVVGPTGCGKSTTLSLITGLLKPTWARCGDGAAGQRHRSAHRLRVPERCGLPWRSVRDNVAAGPMFRGQSKAQAHALADEWIRRVGLDKFGDHYPHQLSGGMRKRVALAADLHQQPRDPADGRTLSALDMQTRTLMQDELLRLWSAHSGSVVFVTHDLEEAIALADKVYVLTARPATLKSVYPSTCRVRG
jgi:NitT/TauT family transport system ATP-binding protein